MKDFIKWLGVNEKVAKIVVWLLIIMITLIIVNTALESTGFPNYAITYDNIVKINPAQAVENIVVVLVSILCFYSIALLEFRAKEFKSITKYALLFSIGDLIVNSLFGYGALQVYIILFIIVFSYLYSNRNKKYILYGVISIVVTTIIQGVWYLSKARFIDYSTLNDTTKTILSLDYFIIIAIVILVKEIYLRKRGEKVWIYHGDAGFGSGNSKTKTNLQRNSQKKSQTQLNKKKRIK